MKCGLEIHQRLNTKKLFCNCESKEGNEDNKVVTRYLTTVKSEIGEKDKVSHFEQDKKTQYKYHVYDNTCLVETDNEPPHEMNREALELVIKIALQLNCHIVDEVQIMRKNVTDGSNTSGFQRTAIVGMNGYIETKEGKVGIQTVCIEEESAGIITKKDNMAEYRLDRLGIPLIEIATDPDIKSAEHARVVAEKIGTMLRVTGKVIRGIGTIRQDVNVSIPEGVRVEIKGAQELRNIVELVNNEVQRQENLNKLITKIKSNFDTKKNKINYEFKIIDLTEIFEGTSSKIIKSNMKNNGKVLGFVIKNHKGILGTELLPNLRYGSELSDYAKTMGVKGIIHSDENLDKYNFSDDELTDLKVALEPGKNDAFVLVIAKEHMARKALEKAYERSLIVTIPEETRKAQETISHFMRPLAGSARMYPETDIPPIEITAQLIKTLKQNMGDGLEEIKIKLEKLLNKDLAKKMIKSHKLQPFLTLVNKGYEPKIVANVYEQTLTELRREGNNVELISDEQIEDTLNQYQNNKIAKKAISKILKLIITENKPIKQIIIEQQLGKITGKELDTIIKTETDFKTIMQKYGLRVDPGEVQQKIKGK